jgi:isopenicillin N synthase-like dioxygenase
LPPTGQARRETRFVNEKPLVGLNRWPPDMPEFRTATTAYYAAMEAMTTRLVRIVAMALDLPPDYFAQAFVELNCTIRLLIHRFGYSRLGPGAGRPCTTR